MIYRQNLHGLFGDFLFPAIFHNEDRTALVKDIQNNGRPAPFNHPCRWELPRAQFIHLYIYMSKEYPIYIYVIYKR
jgi:hypothetical protein